MSSEPFDEVKIFSATRAKERSELGETITAWLNEHPFLMPVARDVSQSSDREFHCLTITLYLVRDASAPVTPTPVPRIYSFTPDKKRRR